MPNYCDCELLVRGNPDDLAKFIEKSRGQASEPLDFGSFVPMPTDADKAWCLANWGTKWNACEPELLENGTRRAKMCFLTAWTPPKPVVVEMSRQFPGLSFVLTYFEGGGGFKGELTCKGGEVTSDTAGEYSGQRGG